MLFPHVTAIYAGLFGLLFLALSIHVVVVRARAGIHHGDGDNVQLNRAIRSHGNFAEYVPFILVITTLIEAHGSPASTIHILLLPLLVSRLMHPIGMRQPVASTRQYAWRATSTTVTWIVLLAAAVLLLWPGLGRMP